MQSRSKINEETEALDLINTLLVQKPEYIQQSYAQLAEYRCIFVSEDFTKEMASVVVALLLYYNKQSTTEPITIYINSNGGDGSALFAIYDMINMISAPIETICMGKCYSAGAFLLAAGTKGRRYVFKHSQIMIHGLQCAFPLPLDDQDDSVAYYSFLNTFNNKIMALLAKHSGQPLKKVKEDCKIDTYLDAKEAINYGLADFILF